jgi:anti-sigma regulatory factor (Ser/Thr protein kinase)
VSYPVAGAAPLRSGRQATNLLLPATVEAVPVVHAAISGLFQCLHEAQETALFEAQYAFHTAVVEIATNIIRHAYPKGTVGWFRLRLSRQEERIAARFEDGGIPFEWRRVRPINDPLSQEGGYGLHLARRALDELDYERDARGRNHWRLGKNLLGPASLSA